MASKKRSDKGKAADKAFTTVAKAMEAADAHCGAIEIAAEEESDKAYALAEQAKDTGNVEKLYDAFLAISSDKLNLEHEIATVRSALLHALHPDYSGF